jgi:hypothetical protein
MDRASLEMNFRSCCPLSRSSPPHQSSLDFAAKKLPGREQADCTLKGTRLTAQTAREQSLMGRVFYRRFALPAVSILARGSGALVRVD